PRRPVRRRDARAGDVQPVAELTGVGQVSNPRKRGTRMLWEIEIRPRGHDAERARVVDEYDLLTHGQGGGGLLAGSARGYLLEGRVSRLEAERLARELLVDELVEVGRLGALNETFAPRVLATVLLR